MTTNTGAARPLDRITRITPNICNPLTWVPQLIGFLVHIPE